MRYLLSFLIVVFSLSGYSQQSKLESQFKVDFKKALNKDFSKTELNAIFSKYSDLLLTPREYTMKPSSNSSSSIYPLANFKSEPLYFNNINRLLNSPNTNQKILAYIVIAGAGDFSKESVLLTRINSRKEEGKVLWAGMALLYFQCQNTTPLFDFLVKNENFGDAHMLPFYVTLNKDSLQQTAYNRINSTNTKARVLAAQILSVTKLNNKTTALLMNAVKNWDIRLKGYAIYSIKQLQIGNLLLTFKPFLDSPQVNSIALDALANSPTKEDNDYLFTLVDKKDTVSDALLDCFYKSKNRENINYWLTLLCTKPISKNYYFSTFDQSLIRSDYILPQLQTAILKIKDPEILGELVRALDGRTDDKSVDIMINFLKNNSATVRYWTASTLKENTSTKIKSPEVKQLIIEGLKDGN